MKKALQISALVLLVVALAAGQAPEPRQATLAVGSATLTEFKGEVVVSDPQGQSGHAQRGQLLTPESIIKVGKGSAILNLQDGSQVLIKDQTRVTLKSPDTSKGSFLELLIGKILLQVQKRTGNAPSFKLGTPSAVITVRGTRFSVEVTKKQRTIVDVFEGLVDVGGMSMEGQPVQLKPGFSTEVEPNQRPARPHAIGGAGAGKGRSDNGVFSPGMRRQPGQGGGSSGGPGFESIDSKGSGQHQEGSQQPGVETVPQPPMDGESQSEPE